VDKWGSQTSFFFRLTLRLCLPIIVCLAPETVASPAADSLSTTTAPGGDEALAYYRDEVHPFIQQKCLGLPPARWQCPIQWCPANSI
jgi:hypothetical protein